MKRTLSLEEYIAAAISMAVFEKIEDGKVIYAEIPGFKGVWSRGSNRQDVVKELRQVLKGWIELQLERGYQLPAIKGARLEELTFA